LVIVVMLGGFAVLISAFTGTPLVGRMYRAIFRSLVLAPLAWGLNQILEVVWLILQWIGHQLAIFLRWLSRQIGRLLWWGARELGNLIVFLALALGRGIRWAWVRLIT